MTLQLKPHSDFCKPNGPVVLLIMDGVGWGAPSNANAVHLAQTPMLDQLANTPLFRTIKAHGTAVGMPSDQDMGNSEVGHNALGAGRVLDQGASLVQIAIRSGTLFESNTWQQGISQVVNNDKTLHLVGLLSDGNVHSHIDHIIAMIRHASEDGITRLRLHALLDGRDVDGRSALKYISAIESVFAGLPDHCDYRIASGGGRMVITMDRYDADWEMVRRGWETHVLGEGWYVSSASEAVQHHYDKSDENDQYIPPFVVVQDGVPVGAMSDGDTVFLVNFRGDRAIELSKAFESESFDVFDRKRVPDVFFAGMMQYDGDLKLPKKFLVDPPQIDHPIGEYFCAAKLRSFAISETQKFGHITYFWNGNKSGYVDQSLETYVEIPSDNIPFDQQPEMKAYDITDKTIELLRTGHFDFARVNFPNGDMVGHTGVMDAVIRAVEVTDECVKKIIDVVNELGGIVVVLADHGNADEMFTIKDGAQLPKTSHTLAPVPFVIAGPSSNIYQLADMPDAGLSNVAGTLCNLLGYDVPPGYDASLVTAR